jgi:hypothetical protein
MATLTISSGVHVGTRDDASDFIDWFAATTTTRFSTFTLSSAGATKTGPQAITGHADLSGAPIEFQIERRARDVLTDSLAAVVIEDLVGGRPRTTLSGFKDAMARSGELVKVAWSERRNDGGAAESFEVWGVLVVANATVRGLNESLSLVLWPCDALGWVGTTNWFLTPDKYTELSA